MTRKIAMTVIVGLVGLMIWSLVSLHLSTRRQIQAAREILESGGSLEALERLIGNPTREYRHGETPAYLRAFDGFKARDGTLLRVYNKEGLPYWWVHVQVAGGDSKIVWYAVANR